MDPPLGKRERGSEWKGKGKEGIFYCVLVLLILMVIDDKDDDDDITLSATC